MPPTCSSWRLVCERAPRRLVPAEDQILADPLVQAMTLTAIVIGFGVATLVLSLVYRVYDSHHSVDLGANRERSRLSGHPG